MTSSKHTMPNAGDTKAILAADPKKQETLTSPRHFDASAPTFVPYTLPSLANRPLVKHSAFVHCIELANLPPQATAESLRQLIMEICIDLTHNTFHCFEVVLFRKLEPVADASATPPYEPAGSATIRVLRWDVLNSLLWKMDGYQWFEHTIAAYSPSVQADSERFASTPPSPLHPSQNRYAYSARFAPFPHLPHGFAGMRSRHEARAARRKVIGDKIPGSGPSRPDIGSSATGSAKHECEMDKGGSSAPAGFSKMIVIHDEETGGPIQVDACRVFVGNVPFRTTWLQLRAFILHEALTAPEFISIVKVKIPTHHLLYNCYGQVIGDQAEAIRLQELLQHIHFQGGRETDPYHEMLKYVPLYSTCRSNGYAIVQTGDARLSKWLIEELNNREFEGRVLTVRYDRYPVGDNYYRQQTIKESPSLNKSLDYADGDINLAGELAKADTGETSGSYSNASDSLGSITSNESTISGEVHSSASSFSSNNSGDTKSGHSSSLASILRNHMMETGAGGSGAVKNDNVKEQVAAKNEELAAKKTKSQDGEAGGLGHGMEKLTLNAVADEAYGKGGDVEAGLARHGRNGREVMDHKVVAPTGEDGWTVVAKGRRTR